MATQTSTNGAPKAPPRITEPTTNVELARRLLSEFPSDKVFEMFADDVVFEFPFNPSLGMAERFEGKTTVVAYLRSMLTHLVGLQMSDIKSYAVAGDPSTVFNEYRGNAKSQDGKPYAQTYMNKMQFRDGKLVLLREMWDSLKVYKSTSGARWD